MPRKVASLLAFALLLAVPASAQEAQEPGEAEEPARTDAAPGLVEYGFKIGSSSPHFRTQSGTGTAFRNLDRSVLSAFSFGAFAEILPDTSGVPISLQGELLFVTKGSGLTLAGEEMGGTDVAADLALSYLEAPLLIEHPLTIGNAEGQFYSGGYLAYAVSRRLDVEAERAVGEATAARLDALRERWDYGVVLGAKIDLELFGTELTYDMRYDFGAARLGGDALNARTGAFSLLFEAAL